MTRVPSSTAGDLLGREKDLAALEDAVRTSRLVSVVGAPGVGKTALVERWLATSAHAAPRAATFVSVEGARTEEDLASKIAGALGVPLPSGGLDRFARVLTTGGVYCWGSADTGQLGGGYGGMGMLSAVPVPLAAPN